MKTCLDITLQTVWCKTIAKVVNLENI